MATERYVRQCVGVLVQERPLKYASASLTALTAQRGLMMDSAKTDSTFQRLEVSGVRGAPGVAIVTTDLGYVERLKEFITCRRQFDVAGCFASGKTALAQIPDKPPHAVLIACELPDISGIECIRRLHVLLPQMPIVALGDTSAVDVLFASLIAGAVGFLDNRLGFDTLSAHVGEALRGEAVFSTQARWTVVRVFRRLDYLSGREAAIVSHLLVGKRQKEIAKILGIETSTVHTHLARLYRKYHAHSWREVVRRLFYLPDVNFR